MELKLLPGPASKSKILNIPNILSFLRLLALPFALNALEKKEMVFIFTFLGFIVVTDVLDGYIARRWKVVSTLGKILDHVIDKLVLLSVTLILAIYWDLPIWFFYFLLTREILTLLIGFYLWRYWEIVGQSNFFGRIAGITLSLCYLSYLLQLDIKSYLLYLTLLFMVGASFNYLRIYFPYLTRKSIGK